MRRLFLLTLVLAILSLCLHLKRPMVETQLVPLIGAENSFRCTVKNRTLIPVHLIGYLAKRGPGFCDKGIGGCGTGAMSERLLPGDTFEVGVLNLSAEYLKPNTESVGIHYVLPFQGIIPGTWKPLTAWADIPRDASK